MSCDFAAWEGDPPVDDSAASEHAAAGVAAYAAERAEAHCLVCFDGNGDRLLT
ncbi:hypothetical protein [Nocardia niwae]|uniref:Uncharacterized protein n=1 Tax=Nocardia niwae TaxID=626084 RepID=A0ABV2X3N7_9NOCA|nr:hypothetical protein [Nocardia niwae]